MLPNYPFELGAELGSKLPSPGRDGLIYVDVRFHGRWDGILVFDESKRCVGVFAGRKVVAAPLPFDVDEIVDVRPASLWNRCLAAIPDWFDPFPLGALALFTVCPTLLAAGEASKWFYLATALVAMLSIRIMYCGAGFIMTRFPITLAGLAIVLVASVKFILALL